MDKLESISSQLANGQPVWIDKSNQNADCEEEIGVISRKNGINSQSSSVEDIPTDRKCDTIDWQDFLYSKFECRSTEQQENEIEKVVSVLVANGEKDSTVSVQQPILAANKGNDKRKRRKIQNKCDHCNKKFTEKRRLAVHRAKIHGVTDTGVSSTCCELCGTVFWSEEALAHHLSRHNTKEHNYHCSYCSRSFTRKDAFRSHERTHTKNYPFQCRFCSKGSVSKIRILFHEAQKHNHVSKGIIFHSCSVCGKSFSSSSELERHELIHRNDLSVKCEQCDKMFKHVRSMRYHLNYYCLNNPKLGQRKESKNQEPGDLNNVEKPQIEPLQQKVYLTEKTDVDTLLESIVTEEIHIKDELTESDASDNDSADRDVVGNMHNG